MRIPRGILLLPLAFLAAFGGAPLLLLTAGSFFPEGSFSLEAHRALLPSGGAYPLLVNSLLLAFAAASLATLLGLLPGIAIGRTDLPGKALWAILLSLPLLLPPVFVAAGWRPWTAGWAGSAAIALPLRFAGATLVLTLMAFPIPLFLTALSVRRTDGALEDVARLHGGDQQVLRSMVLDLARPGISLAWLLVFLLALEDNGVPGLFGVATYAGEVADFEASAGWRFMGAASFPLILAALAIATLEARLFGERGVAFLARTYRAAPRTLALGAARVPVLALLGLLALLSLGMPLLGWTVAAHAGGVDRGAAVLGAAWREGAPAFGRSLGLALGGGSLAVLVGVPLAYAVERGALNGRRWVDLGLVLLFVVPGSVLASGLVRFLPIEMFVSSGSALLVGYGVHLAVVPYRMERVALRQLGVRSEEAGMLAGAGWGRRVRDLVLPLNAEFLGGVWIAALLLAFRDGEIGVALSPTRPTLAALGEAAAGTSPEMLGALATVAAGLGALTLVAGALLVLVVERARAVSVPPRELRPAAAGGDAG